MNDKIYNKVVSSNFVLKKFGVYGKGLQFLQSNFIEFYWNYHMMNKVLLDYQHNINKINMTWK